MKTYSIDLRKRIVAARAKGHSVIELARLFGISKSTVERYWKQQMAVGSVHPKQRGGYRRSALEGYDETLRRWIAETPDLTLRELQERLCNDLGIELRQTALWHRLERLGLSYKKNATRRRAGASRH